MKKVDFRGLGREVQEAASQPCGLFGSQSKLFLIVENLRVHHAVMVRSWEAEHHNDIELVFLTAYAQEHNPDEYLNNDIKQKLKNQPKPNTQEDLVNATTSVRRSLQRRPERIRSYFHTQHVRYAA